MNTRHHYYRRFGKILIIALIVFALVHFAVLLYFLLPQTERTRLFAQQQIGKANAALLQLISAAETDPQLPQIISELNDAQLHFKTNQVHLSITDEPLWLIRYPSGDNTTPLVRTLQKQNFSFSYQLANNNWINYSIMPLFNFRRIALLMMTLDLLAIAIILFYLWSISRFAIPLRRFQQSAEQLGIDVHSKPIDVSGPKIVRDTANAINQLQQRIQALLENRTKAIAAISHDLRTPITRLKLRNQLITNQELANKTNRDLEELEIMIDMILAYSREDIVSKEAKKKFDLHALLSSICDDFSDLGHPVSFQANVQHMPYLGRMLAFKRALTNIINNAVQRATQVDVVLTQTQKKITLTVTDNGPGIPQAKLKHVLGAFQQVHHGSGFGLGLTIANEVVQTHYGNIALTNVVGGGLQVTITLPT